MEPTDVELDEKPRAPRTISVNSHPNPLAIKRGSAVSPKSRPASVQVQERPDLNQSLDEVDLTTEQLRDAEIEDKPRPPRVVSVNHNPNPLTIRRGSAVTARSQSPKPFETPNPESTEYSTQLKQFLEAGATEPVEKVPNATEGEEKPRAPRTFSITSNAANPLAQRRGSSVKSSQHLNPPEKLPEEETAQATDKSSGDSGEQDVPASVAPPPLPSSPAPAGLAEEDLSRPSISLSFGGLYDIRPSMIETEYVSDLPEREYREVLPVIRESESDNMEDMYDLRASTIAVERPPPPVPAVAPPLPPSLPPPVPVLPPPPSSPPLSHDTRVSISYDSDSEDPLTSTNQYNTSTTNYTNTNANSSSSSTYTANTTAFSTVPLHYPTPSATTAVEMTSLAWKLCPSVTIVWQERFFVLKKDGSIHYYTDKDTFLSNFAPRGVICISDIQRVKSGLFVELQQNKLNIGVNSKNSRVYKLKFGTAEEAKKWYDAIHKYARV